MNERPEMTVKFLYHIHLVLNRYFCNATYSLPNSFTDMSNLLHGTDVVRHIFTIFSSLCHNVRISMETIMFETKNAGHCIGIESRR
jgi:hypothetical protein